MSSITLFEEKHVRRAWNSTEEKWYFSIDDVVAVPTGSANVEDYIKKLRKRDPALETYWGTNCPLVAMPGADGKIRPIRAAKSGTKVSTKENFKALTEGQTKALPSRQSKAD